MIITQPKPFQMLNTQITKLPVQVSFSQAIGSWITCSFMSTKFTRLPLSGWKM